MGYTYSVKNSNKEISKADAKNLAIAGKSFIIARAKDLKAYRITDFEEFYNEYSISEEHMKNFVKYNFDNIVKSEFYGNPKLLFFEL